MGFIRLLQLLAAALPLIHQGIAIAEQVFPGAKTGAAKLTHVADIVAATLPAIGATVDQVQQLRAPLEAIVSTVANAMNAAGTMPKASSSAPAPAAAAPDSLG